MGSIALGLKTRRLPCYYRPAILTAAAVLLFCVFWFTSRYPQLLNKAEHVGQALPSMAFAHEVLTAAEGTASWQRVLFGAVNWLESMKTGMAFGVLLGALLHTALRYYPLKVGKNLYLNSLKGALVGVPMGVCANCAVPAACGLTRGNGRIEVALGFLFSSPSFNPVVMMMTFAALPWTMSVTRYALLLLVILGMVPALIRWLERKKPLAVFTAGGEEASCALPLAPADCTERFAKVAGELALDYGRNVWMLLKPTVTIMLLASVVSSAILTLIPFPALLSVVTPARVALVSLISVFMPVPIALDVMFAAQLYQQGVPGGYVMLFAMTLGTYSIIPAIYLWREVSKPLAVILWMFFMLVGFITGLTF